jgi:DNA (cytosine-5)-methyltransferase 1
MKSNAVLSAFESLLTARAHHSRKDLARFLKVDTQTIRNWEARQPEPPPEVAASLQWLLPHQLSLRYDRTFSFIDLFAGIGGLRHAFEDRGGECVFTSEWDAYAQKTYLVNYREAHRLNGDITAIHESEIPDHDLLLAGFPCQPFSIAGVSKKNALGRAHGFADETQGTLFFDVARIIKEKRPRAFLLENVKNLQSHDQGRTFEVIRRTLAEELGYHISWRVLDAAHFVPQHRERILIVGFREPSGFDWASLNLMPRNTVTLKSILHRADRTEPNLPWDGGRYYDAKKKRALEKYTLTPGLWSYLQEYKAKHQAKGNGFGFGLFGPDDVARTLSARYYKDGSEVLIDQGKRKRPRRLTPRECARLMGFPDSFVIPVSDTRAYKQFGNSVVVPAIREVARIMQPYLTGESGGQQPLLVSIDGGRR